MYNYDSLVVLGPSSLCKPQRSGMDSNVTSYQS